MNHLLAQATPSGSDIGNWLLAATCVLVMLERAFSFWKSHLREQPTPSETYWKRIDGEKAVSELEAVVRRNDEYGRARRAGIYAELKSIREEMTQMAGELYETVKPIGESVSAMKEADSSAKTRLQTIEADIKTLLRRSN